MSEAATSVVHTKVVTAGRSLTVVATGYALGGRTSTGLPVGWGVVAVDPSVIPLGTHMTVPGYGEAVAADVGGAVRGAVDRSLVPDGRAGERVGPALGDGHPPLTRLHFADLLSPRQALADQDRTRSAAHRTARSTRRRSRPLPRGVAELARGAGRADRGRMHERHGRSARGARARAGRRRDGPQHAGHQRRRGDASDLDDRAADARARTDDLGSGRGRDGRDPRGRVRLPPQGRFDYRAFAGNSCGGSRRVARVTHDRCEGPAARESVERVPPRSRSRSSPSSPTARSRCSS